MPSKFAYQEEVCFPCKYWATSLYRSGRDPIYHRYCQHPSQMNKHFSLFGDKGEFISDSSDQRPQWCPIRGDKQAEQEAEADE